jgi:chaperone required for assembly of F1-ATPase
MAAPAKRFWKTTSMVKGDSGWMVHLDQRPLKTPAGQPLVLTGEALTRHIHDEWDAQGDHIIPATMPMFRYAVTAVDRVTPQRDQVIDQMLDYTKNEMLCYRTPDQPELAEEQNRHWQPWLDWAQQSFHLTFEVAEGIMPISQPEASVKTAKTILSEMDDFRLAGVFNLISISGSFVVGLAVSEGQLSPQNGYEIAFLEERWQAKQWGSDEDAENRRQRLKQDMIDIGQYLSLLETA